MLEGSVDSIIIYAIALHIIIEAEVVIEVIVDVV